MSTSKLFTLNYSDVAKGLVVAILVALLGAIQNALNGHGLDVATYDWGNILDVAWKAGVAYLGKNYLSDPEGKVVTPFGRIG